MRAARLPAWSSPNFLNTANGNASQRLRCWKSSTLRRVRWMSMPATRAYPARGRTKPRIDSAVHRLRGPGSRNHDEADLPLLHHAETLASDPLDVRGIVQLCDLPLQPGVLLLQELRLPLQAVQALALGHVGANGDHEIEEESRHHERQHGRPRSEPDAPPCVSGD